MSSLQTDPEAAKIVFESGVPLTMVPLECTHTALADMAVMHAVRTGCDLPTAIAATSTVRDRQGDDRHGDDRQMMTDDGDTHHHPSSTPSPSAAATSPFRAKMAELLQFFAHTYKDVFQFQHPPLHDPCAVAYVIAPELFDVQVMRVVCCWGSRWGLTSTHSINHSPRWSVVRHHVSSNTYPQDIETVSELSAGQTVCDVWNQSSKPKNAHVVRGMDVQGFWRVMLDALVSADEASPLNNT